MLSKSNHAALQLERIVGSHHGMGPGVAGLGRDYRRDQFR